MTRFWEFIAGVEKRDSTKLDARTEGFNLSVFRVLFFLIVFVTMSGHDYFLQWTEVPKVFWFPKSLNLFLEEPPNSEYIRALFYLWQATTLLCVLGVFYRFIAPVWWVSCLIVTMYGHSFGYYGHVYMPVVLAGLPMALARASSHLSIDSWWKRRNGEPLEEAGVVADRLALRTVQLILVMSYFAAGFAKLRYGGIEWMSGDTLRNYLFRSSVAFADTNALAHMVSLNSLLVQVPLLCNVLAVFAVFTESLAPLAFFRRRFAYFLIPMIVGLQIGIFFTIYVRFTPYLAIVGAWVNWYWLWHQIQKLRWRSERKNT